MDNKTEDHEIRIRLLERAVDGIDETLKELKDLLKKSKEMSYRIDGFVDQQYELNKNNNKDHEKLFKQIGKISANQKWFLGVGTGIMSILTIINIISNLK